MPALLTTTYTARFASPELIERAKAQRLVCEVQYEGAVVRPASGTLTIRDGGNVAVVDEAAVTVGDDGVAYYELAAAIVPETMSTSQQWLVEWTLVFGAGDDAQTHTFRRTAHLCLRRLYPVVTVGDITRRHHDLQELIKRGINLQTYGDDAWDSVVFRFLGEGREPQKVMSPDRFAEAHKALWLHRVYLDCIVETGDRYDRLQEHWDKEYERAWTSMRVTLDRNEDNLPPNGSEQGESATPPLMLSAGPVGRWRYNGGRP